MNFDACLSSCFKKLLINNFSLQQFPLHLLAYWCRSLPSSLGLGPTWVLQCDVFFVTTALFFLWDLMFSWGSYHKQMLYYPVEFFIRLFCIFCQVQALRVFNHLVFNLFIDLLLKYHFFICWAGLFPIIHVHQALTFQFIVIIRSCFL